MDAHPPADAAGEALIVCWRLLLVVFMGVLLMATTRTADIRAALVWYLKPIPFVNEKMAATMVGLVVRFLPVILFQAGEIADAQRARGIERRKNPLIRLMRFTIPLFRRVFLSADELVAAMQARCYNEHRTLPDLSFSGAMAWPWERDFHVPDRVPSMSRFQNHHAIIQVIVSRPPTGWRHALRKAVRWSIMGSV